MTDQHENVQQSDTNPNTPVFPAFDIEAARLQLKLLGYKPGDSIKINCLYHKSDPRSSTGGGRPLESTFPNLPWKEIQKNQMQGRCVYFAPNGSLKQAEIKQCRAIFSECDEGTTEEQVLKWRKKNLPDPSIELFSGNKSVHTYLTLNQPCTPEQFTELQKDLAEHLSNGADKSLHDTCQLMRLAGAWHISPGKDPVRVDFVSTLGYTYDYEELRTIIPRRQREEKAKPKHKDNGEANEMLNFVQYLNGFQENGRASWHTAECPLSHKHHSGNHSQDSLHVEAETGAYKCHAGCNSKDVWQAARSIAISKGHKAKEKNMEEEDGRKEEVQRLIDLHNSKINFSKMLPPALADAIMTYSKWMNVKPETCLLSLLTAVSSLHKTGTELIVRKAQNFNVPPTLYSTIVSPSGQKKSPIERQFFHLPMRGLIENAAEKYKDEQKKYKRESEFYKLCKSSKNRKDIEENFPDGEPQEPRQKVYIVSDTTTEGLANQFQAHPEKPILYLKDELSGLVNSFGKYTGGKGDDREFYLSAYDGTSITILRAGGVKVHLDKIALSIFGTIQPNTLDNIIKDKNDSDGFWSRFLFVNQPLTAATLPDDDDSDLDITGVLAKYYENIVKLPVMEYKLSPEAYKAYQSYYNYLEQTKLTLPAALANVYAKHEGLVGRLAINLHVLHNMRITWRQELAFPSVSEIIPLDIVELAVALSKFFIGQIELTHANMSNQLSPQWLKIIELSKKKGWVKAKDVQQGYKAANRPKPDAIRVWFKEMHQLGLGELRGEETALEFLASSKEPVEQSVDQWTSQWNQGSTAESIDTYSVDNSSGYNGTNNSSSSTTPFNTAINPDEVQSPLNVCNEDRESGSAVEQGVHRGVHQPEKVHRGVHREETSSTDRKEDMEIKATSLVVKGCFGSVTVSVEEPNEVVGYKIGDTVRYMGSGNLKGKGENLVVTECVGTDYVKCITTSGERASFPPGLEFIPISDLVKVERN
ncbi:hypothetical protein DSM107010_36900 [Chroococcidiopsis cubana SAG 39.79]|uniref:DUF3987 domain-containing protein n=1 Tax=Chroococcidiopsis cubana SAG 39.79 TaxID=388085 RepID=A0AB37UI48_9CYAN|nr:DUF3987 domain-containing protein [Chroococcidiopsis cubana]PSB63366.1 hypothetical protein C7B79_14215 [Chroococcidiopsis cubana CCALA 043]RUT11056.1 hypothetical protein DSM107010_36900 [Chroococcidiopsis cubana SAG 39.79]